MSASTIWGLLGDSLSFLGALILALDALWREREFIRQKKLLRMVETLRVRLTLDGIELVDGESTHLVFIRQSVRRSIWGASILTSGFICLLVARIVEIADSAKIRLPH